MAVVKTISDRQDNDKIQPTKTISVIDAGEQVYDTTNQPKGLQESGRKPTKTIRLLIG